MQNPNFDETVPSKPDRDENDEHLAETHRTFLPIEPPSPDPEPETQAPPPPDNGDDDGDDSAPHTSEKPSRRQGLRRASIAIVIFLVIVGVGAFSGYTAGIDDRLAQEKIRNAAAAAEQYQLALVDIDNGNYGIAVQRLEYVIRVYPDFPGAADKMIFASMAMQSTATATIVPTATLIPTPDMRSQEELFQQAAAYAQAQDWDNLLATLDSLRKADPNYRTVEVDDFYYLGLRNRGVQRILLDADLEGGIFDLNLAERFGPIDAQAASYRQWAEWYVTGASFWGIDWGQVITYFEYVVPQAPNLRDSDEYTAQQRLATAQIHYATQAIYEGDIYAANKQWCEADTRYKYVAEHVGVPPEMQSTVDWLAFKCELEIEENGGN
jgi:hypothetical protein